MNDSSETSSPQALSLVASTSENQETDAALPQDVFELRRGALWEDVLHGCWLTGLLGVLLYPTLGLTLEMAGAQNFSGQIRGTLAAGLLLAVMAYARTKISSRMVIEPEERAIYDAVRIGQTVYLQGSTSFDQIETIELVRRERRRVVSDQGPESDIPLEGRGILRLGPDRIVPLTNWYEEDYSKGAPWHRLRSDLRKVALYTGAELVEGAEIEPPIWEFTRYVTWILSIGLSAGVLVIIGGW